MDCVRCQGFMVVDCFVDLAASGETAFNGWRCVVCGNISDPVIIANRHTPLAALTRCGATASS